MSEMLYWLGIALGVTGIGFIIAGVVKLLTIRNATRTVIQDVAMLTTFGGVLYALASFVGKLSE